MNLAYAVDRLYDGGWLPSHTEDLETLPDGRTFPSIFAVQREFTANAAYNKTRVNRITTEKAGERFTTGTHPFNG